MDKVAEQHIAVTYTANAILFKLQVIHLTWIIRIAIAQLCNELQVCNFTML